MFGDGNEFILMASTAYFITYSGFIMVNIYIYIYILTNCLKNINIVHFYMLSNKYSGFCFTFLPYFVF